VIYIPSIARFRLVFLEERIAAAHLATVALEVPPGDPVLRADDRRFGAQACRQALGDWRQAVGLERDEDGVNIPKRAEVIGCVHPHGRLAIRFDQPQPRLAHGLEMWATRDEDDVGAGSLFATGLVAGGTLTGTIVAFLHWGDKVGAFVDSLDISDKLTRALGAGGYQILGVACFAVMGLLLYRIARRPMQL